MTYSLTLHRDASFWHSQASGPSPSTCLANHMSTQAYALAHTYILVLYHVGVAISTLTVE